MRGADDDDETNPIEPNFIRRKTAFCAQKRGIPPNQALRRRRNEPNATAAAPRHNHVFRWKSDSISV